MNACAGLYAVTQERVGMQVGKRMVGFVAWLSLSACAQQGTPVDLSTPQFKPTITASQVGLLRTQFGAFASARVSALALEGTRGAVTPSFGQPSLYLVRSTPHRAGAARSALVNLGILVHGYFPDDAWTISATAEQARVAAGLDDVVDVAPMPTSLKLQQPMVRVTGRGLVWASSGRTADVWVELARAQDAAVVSDAVAAVDGRVVADGSGLQILRVQVPRDGLATLVQMPEVLSVEPWTQPQATNDVSAGVLQSGKAQVTPLWEHGLRGQGQIVGLSDSGVDTQSCYFAGDKVVGYAEFTGIHDGDGTGHGTHVAGSIAGSMGGDGQPHPHDGMAPQARLYVEDVGAGSVLVGIPGDLSTLFGPAYEAGARIHSNSWVGGSARYGVMSRALDRFVSQHPDFLPLFAAGNTGRRTGGQVLEPALAKNVVAVGAMDGAFVDRVAEFSARGPTADGRVKPMLVAPGVAVVSAAAHEACGTQVLSGTSMATPTAAGGVALARQYYTEGYYPTGAARAEDAITPTAALLKATLIAGAVDMSLGENAGGLPGTGQGFGRMQLDNTLVFDTNATHLWLHDETRGLADAETSTFVVHVSQADQPMRIALAWTDPPASPGAARALVNDLDLEIRSPDGVLYRGNGLQGGEAVADAERDGDNVEELAAFAASAAGDWQITVRAANVPMGPQTFALVAVGSFAP